MDECQCCHEWSLDEILSFDDNGFLLCDECRRDTNDFYARVAQLAERQSSKLAVVGSTPITRSISERYPNGEGD